MRVIVDGTLAVLFSLIAPGLALAQAAPATERISQVGRWFTDREGRVLTIRGGNVMLPTFAPNGEPRWTSDTPAKMAEQGFNGVRLVIFFKDLMPHPGQVDHAYIERISRAVAAFKAVGIYTMVDFHQDQYGPLTGGRGMPDWAVFSDGHRRMPDIAFPMGYFKDPAVQRSFDNFWKNHEVPGTGKGVQDLYVEGLLELARRFRNEPAVLGIDVMNEPSPGSRCVQADPVVANCPELEQELLKPFYAKIATTVNRVAPEMILFYEPFMLQGALGVPIDTPISGRKGSRGFSFHNYGPVRATRAKINDFALGVAHRHGAAIINTEWGFSNDPGEVTSQAADFDMFHISWLAWTRGSFEALVDPALPDQENGNRIAILRSYARPYAEATAGSPELLQFDGLSGTMTYRFATDPIASRLKTAETRIRIPAVQYPNGYHAVIEGGTVISAERAPLLRVRNRADAKKVVVRVTRLGELPPLPKISAEPGNSGAAMRSLPPIPEGPLSRNSMIGHIVATSGGRALMERQLPGLLTGISHVAGWERMTLTDLQQFASSILNEAKLGALDIELSKLVVIRGPVSVGAERRLSIDSLTSDLVADLRTRAIVEKEIPGFSGLPQQGLYPQTRFRSLQAVIPNLLTDDVLKRIEEAFRKLNAGQ